MASGVVFDGAGAGGVSSSASSDIAAGTPAINTNTSGRTPPVFPFN